MLVVEWGVRTAKKACSPGECKRRRDLISKGKTDVGESKHSSSILLEEKNRIFKVLFVDFGNETRISI